MNKAIVFDTGPIISLTLNNLLKLLKPLKDKSKTEFYVCPSVYKELIEKPLSTKKYKFEALQILPLFMDGTLKFYERKENKRKAEELLSIANKCFIAKGNYISIVHIGEMEAIASALALGSDTLVIDERTTRVLIENPYSLVDHLEKKLHTSIEVNRDNIEKISKEISGLNVIRSFELGFVAFELGLLDEYIIKEEEKIEGVGNIRSSVLEGILWAIKLSGCSVSRNDIDVALKSSE